MTLKKTDSTCPNSPKIGVGVAQIPKSTWAGISPYRWETVKLVEAEVTPASEAPEEPACETLSLMMSRSAESFTGLVM
jgi:hypothetical protein